MKCLLPLSAAIICLASCGIRHDTSGLDGKWRVVRNDTSERAEYLTIAPGRIDFENSYKIKMVVADHVNGQDRWCFTTDDGLEIIIYADQMSDLSAAFPTGLMKARRIRE